ncbi:MAG: hypothetical protein Q9169_004384 [Polycauliona sp. 2 TL-2023]
MARTMTSTIYPSSSNLTIPSTQNTAPVLSYNCLYTHDLKRKAKRWQDGFLKYHTFNKRIMVYDVPRNFIGDTHWREPEPIQDGDELRLEKGILIQVGEEVKVERTETDLTELLGKRKPKPACDGPSLPLPVALSTPTRPQPSFTNHSTPDAATLIVNSQLRPKTLNALLGRPKGPVGRAFIPSRSLAEERRGKENRPVDGMRSPKRRKIQHPVDSSPTSPHPVNRRNKAVPTAATTATRSTISSTVTNPTNNNVSKAASKALSDTTHHDSSILLPGKSGTGEMLQSRRADQQTNRLTPDPNNVEIIEDSSPVHGPARGRLVQSTRQKRKGVRVQSGGQKNRPGEGKKSQEPSNHISEGRQSIYETRRALSEDFEDGPRPENRLRIASSKPRRKLMYQDLPPQKPPPRDTVESAESRNPRKEMPNRPSSKSYDKRPGPSVSLFHQAQQDRLDARLSRRKHIETIVENHTEEPLLSLREDEGEDIYTREKSPVPNEAEVLESLFLSQSSLHELPSEASNLPVGQPKDPREAQDPLIQLHSLRGMDVDGTCDLPDNGDKHNGRQSPDTSKTWDPIPPSEDIPNEPHNNQDTSKPARTATTLTDGDSLPLRRPMVPPNSLNPLPKPVPEPEPKPKPPNEPLPPNLRPSTIKAAMPPRPLPRSFSRSTSDPNTLTIPLTINQKRTSGLLKSYSNGFTPLNLHNKPPPPPPRLRPTLHITSTNLTNTNNDNNTTTEIVLDSRPNSAKEQVVEPWSREAYDLFGFEDGDKRVGTGNGVSGEKDGGGGVVRGDDGWLVASQGFV